MKMLPYFPFYPGEWLRSPTIMGMSLCDQGAYLRLLCVQWEDGFIDPGDIPMILDMDDEKVSTMLAGRAWRKALKPDKEGMLRNERLHADREDALRKAENASAAAHKRWRKHKETGSPVVKKRSAEAELDAAIATAEKERGSALPDVLKKAMLGFLLARRSSKKSRGMWSREQWVLNLGSNKFESDEELTEAFNEAARCDWSAPYPVKKNTMKRRTNTGLESLKEFVRNEDGSY